MAVGNPVLSRDLIELWEECVWSRPEIREFTRNVHPCNVTGDQDSTCDLYNIMDCDRINFVQYFIQRYPRNDQVGRCRTFRYRVQIEYYREDSCEDQNKIQEFFEVLDDTIRAQLGPRWKDCVEVVERQDDFPDISPFGTIENRLVYVGSFEYLAEATASN